MKVKSEREVAQLCLTLSDPIALGASVRNSAHGKGHEEGSLAYAEA